ncbi:MAG: hypothetical protein JXI43_05980 [Tissierellales bacterium]|nr:hypothetical protein [Tissierellales bacterium]
MTIPSCNECNKGWSDNEVHFRNVLALAGEPNEARRELWETTIRRSFEKEDGIRRVRDLVEILHSVEIEGNDRQMVYPGQDERVLRIIKKIIRGLCHYHGVISAVSEKRIWADILKYKIPEEFLPEMAYEHREQDIAEYRYQILHEYGINSAWLITFFQRVNFVGTVSMSEDGSYPEKEGQQWVPADALRALLIPVVRLTRSAR